RCKNLTGLAFAQFAFPQSEIELHAVSVLVNDDSQVRLLRHSVLRRPASIVRTEHNMIQFLLGDQVRQTAAETRNVRAEDNENAQLVGAVLWAGLQLLVELLDQTGQGVADFARENQSDQMIALHSDRADLFPGVIAIGAVEQEFAIESFADLWSGL